MPDVKVTVKGNSGGSDGAATALKDVATEAKKADKALDELGTKGAGSAEKGMAKAVALGGLAALAISKAASAAVDFAKSSISAFMEQEKADKQLAASLEQLGYSAERVTPFLKNQADAMSRSLGVSGEMIQRMQALMVTFGVAPKDIQKTTQAILDYSARTGVDAEQATSSFIKAIANGGQGLSKMGVQITATGDKSKDLAAAVEAMGQKFGGAALANTGTLSGQMARLQAETGDLHKAFGGFLAMVNAKTGAMNALAEALRGVNMALNDPDQAVKDAFNQEQLWTKILGDAQQHAKRFGAIVKEKGGRGAAAALPFVTAWDAAVKKVREAELKLEALGNLRKQQRDELFNVASPDDLDKSADVAAAERKEKAAKESSELMKELAALEKKDAEHYAQQRLKQDEANHDIRQAHNQKLYEEEQDAAARHLDEIARAERDDWNRRQQQSADLAAAAGAVIGNAFGNAISSAIAGEEQDITTTIFDVLGGVAAAVASFYGMPYLAPVISGTVSGIGRGLSNAGRTPRAHDGGWSDDLRGRAGWEIPALLAPGERVLAPGEVSRMGGASAVDSLARGGGGGENVTVVINANDAASFREYLGREGGDAFRRVTNQNRGIGTVLRRLGAYD